MTRAGSRTDTSTSSTRAKAGLVSRRKRGRDVRDDARHPRVAVVDVELAVGRERDRVPVDVGDERGDVYLDRRRRDGARCQLRVDRDVDRDVRLRILDLE